MMRDHEKCLQPLVGMKVKINCAELLTPNGVGLYVKTKVLI